MEETNQGKLFKEALSPAPSQDLPSSQSQSQSTDNSVENSTPTPQISIEDLATVAIGSNPMDKETDQRKRYDNLCRTLNVTEETKDAAWGFLSRIPPDDNTPEHENLWFACALFLTGSKRLNGTANGLSLSTLLRQTNIRMVDFFEPIKSFIAVLQLGSQYEEQLKILEKKFVVITILFHKYEKMFGDLLQLPTSTDRASGSKKKSDSFQIFHFGWTLFLVCKGKLLNDPPDLVNAFHALLCCLNLLFVHVPAHLRKVSFKDPAMTPHLHPSDSSSINTLAYICEINNANYAECSSIHERLFTPFLQMLSRTQVLATNPAKVPTEPALAKSLYFGGLLEGSFLQKNKSSIVKEYEKMYYDGGDFDERLYIDHFESIGTPSKVALPTRNYYNINSKTNTKPDTLTSPNKNPPPSTPMTTTLATLSWLKDAVASIEDGPTEALLKFFKACSRDVTQEILDRLSKLMATVQVPEKVKGDFGSEKPRFDLGTKLYYRILESLLVSESQRLKEDNFTPMLTNDMFHRSLLACCLEIVTFSYKITLFPFPSIINSFQVPAFEFVKIIESVIRHSPELPKVIVKHLCQIEERILESLAWEENSPLINLIKEKGAPEASSNTNPLLLSPNPKGNANPTIFLSPAPKQKPNPTTPNKSSLTPNDPNKTKKSSSLDLFFRKVFQVANIRAHELCTRLSLSPKIYHQVWQALTQAISDPVCLMQNRHLDQIIMCCIYGVSRVNQQAGITFRAIIDQYRAQPQANSKIFREVVLQSKDKTGDIINFYNTIFIPQMEQFLLKFQQNASTEKENAFSTAIASPGKISIPKSPQPQKLYLSPMRSNLRSLTPGLPLGKLSFSIGSSPLKDLQQINDTINTTQRNANKPVKRLFSDHNNDNVAFSDNNNDNVAMSEASLKRKSDTAFEGPEGAKQARSE